MSIICKPCFAFDALAAIEGRSRLRDDIPYIKEQIEENFTGMDFITSSDIYYRFLLDKYSFDEIEKMDLKTLAELYPDCIDDSKFWWEQKNTKEHFIKSFEVL
ncbi:MAG: hypothetical protein FWG20_01625, partial [Candidatus Cloacimonetes bacterium]|nr:hypothetical protein [Candidatus Cloacimonadota bacterium]